MRTKQQNPTQSIDYQGPDMFQPALPLDFVMLQESEALVMQEVDAVTHTEAKLSTDHKEVPMMPDFLEESLSSSDDSEDSPTALTAEYAEIPCPTEPFGPENQVIQGSPIQVPVDEVRKPESPSTEADVQPILPQAFHKDEDIWIEDRPPVLQESSNESTAPSPALSVQKSDGTGTEIEFQGEVEGRYVCRLCGREFRFEKNLLRHMHKTHAMGDDESVLKCKLCNYTTKHYSNMYVHIRTHTGDKPYWCSACGASFTQGSSLKLHIKSRHDDNMKFFSLNKKLGKNNLTKLWQRVLKKDLANLNTVDINPSMIPPLTNTGRMLPMQNGSNPHHGPGNMFPSFHPHFNPFQAAAAAAMGLNAFHPLLAPFGNPSPAGQNHMKSSPVSMNGATLNMPQMPHLQMCPLDLKLKRESAGSGSPGQENQPLSAVNGQLAPSPQCHMPSLANIKHELASPNPSHGLTGWPGLPLQQQQPPVTEMSHKSQQTEKQISLSEMYLTEENLRIRAQLETLRENARKLLLAIYPNAQRELVGPRVDDILAETVRTAIPAIQKS